MDTEEHKDFLVDRLFQSKRRLYSTRLAEGYSAVHDESGETAMLWKLRYPIPSNQNFEKKLSDRLELIKSLGGLVPEVFDFGIDSAGAAFVISQYLEGDNLSRYRASSAHLERVFVSILEIVAKLHAKGIVLGDICDNSFIVDSKGDVYFVAVLGGFEGDVSKTALLPPPETFHYLAPEQRGSAKPILATDIYALGALAYRMFTGRHMFGENISPAEIESQAATVPAPSVVNSDVPVWVDDIIGKCVETKPEDRFVDAGELLNAVQQAIRNGVAPGGTSRWSRRTMIVSTNTQLRTRKEPEREKEVSKPSEEQELEPQVKGFSTPQKLFIGSAIIGASIVLIIYFIGGLFGKSFGGSSLNIDISQVPAELQPLVETIASGRSEFTEKQDAIQRLGESDDVIAGAILMTVIRNSEESPLRRTAESVLASRVRNSGLNNSAVLLERWFTAVENAQQNPANHEFFSLLLRAFDTNIAVDERRKIVQQIYKKDSALSLQLAAALALDYSQTDEFTPVLRQVLGAHYKRDDLSGKSAGALVLSDPMLLLFFDKEISHSFPKFSAEELLWSLEQLGKTEGTLLLSVADEVLKRKLVPPFQAVFLQALSKANHFELGPPVRMALVNGALSKIQQRDVVALSSWSSLDAETTLLAVCATVDDSDISLGAFDSLASRSLEQEPTRSIIHWIRQRFWTHRQKIVKAVGIIGHYEISSQDQIEYAIDLLVPFSTSGSLLEVMVDSGRPELIDLSFDRLGPVTPSDVLVSLLSHGNPRVRTKAVESLAGRNDLNVLQGVVKGYEREKDESVREVYRKHHWVTQSRK